MTLILIPVSMFGMLSVIQIARIFLARALIARNRVTKTGTVVAFAINCYAIFFAHEVVIVVFLTLSSLILYAVVLILLERHCVQKLRAEVPFFFDCWLLNLRLGHSLSSAADKALQQSSNSMRTLLEPLFLAANFTPTKHLLFPHQVLREIRILTHSPHQALERLENLRTGIRKAEQFRRKSGQATQQARIQALVLLSLQLALTIFTVHRYGWRHVDDLVVGSWTLGLLGFWVMCRLARKTKWKI